MLLLADAIAPYSPEAQQRDFPFAPPTPIRLGDGSGLGFWPHAVELEPDPQVAGTYRAAAGGRRPLRLWIAGEPRRLLGLVPIEHRLFGVDGGTLFLLGTDRLGRDVFSRLLYGGRTSLLAGAAAALLALLIGTAVGAVAGFAGGRVDALAMRATELVMALPWLYLLLAFRALLPLDLAPLRSVLYTMLLLGLLGWARPARLVRGVALTAREQDFVTAARAQGVPSAGILLRHVLPQAANVIATQAAILLPAFMVAEVTLTFLGLGVAEPAPSWGAMLAQLQDTYVLRNYWWMSSPAVLLVVVFMLFFAAARSLERSGAADGPR